VTWPVELVPLNHPPASECLDLKTEKGCIYCCAACDYDQHICPGCGANLTHLGHERQEVVEYEPDTLEVVATYITYRKHEGCTDG